MRLDHVAYRVNDRHKTAAFFMRAFGYRLQDEFRLPFGDGTFADCIALEPPEKVVKTLPWSYTLGTDDFPHTTGPDFGHPDPKWETKYHLAPEIFVSDGTPGSIVGDWVAARGGVGGIHHLAYQVDDVALTMKVWKAGGYAEFASEAPLHCPGLTQVFTRPSDLTGVIYEFIKRTGSGFCAENVLALMESTRGNDRPGESRRGI